jgi:hypothetical protein
MPDSFEFNQVVHDLIQHCFVCIFPGLLCSSFHVKAVILLLPRVFRKKSR